MRELQASLPHWGTHVASKDRSCTVPVLRTPRQNRLLAALPPADYARLLPDLIPVDLPLGWTVHGAGAPERYLYFIADGIVSRSYVAADGASTELAISGNEGVIGVASFLGGGSTLSQAVVVSTGHAYRLRAEVLSREVEREGPLANLLLRYALALIAQTGQIAVCNRHHAVKQQLSRLILTCLDRLTATELAMTHELIARVLGIRREGVTAAVGKLQSARLIRCTRARITLLDRAGLEAQACECYAVVKREYDRLLCPNSGAGLEGAHDMFRGHGAYR